MFSLHLTDLVFGFSKRVKISYLHHLNLTIQSVNLNSILYIDNNHIYSTFLLI